MTNALTLPGLGTVAAGRRRGYVQASLAVVGFGLSLLWAVNVGRQWLATGEFPETVDGGFFVGLGGVGLYASAWLWALGSSLALLREARRAMPPSKP